MSPAAARSGFRSSAELREILDAVLREIDDDPDDGPRLRAAAGPLRFEFTDMKLALNVHRGERGGHPLSWDFSRSAPVPPRLQLTMSSDVANRLLQGRENPAIAIARGRVRTSVRDAAAALSFFAATKPLFSRYRELVLERYPHLTVD